MKLKIFLLSISLLLQKSTYHKKFIMKVIIKNYSQKYGYISNTTTVCLPVCFHLFQQSRLLIERIQNHFSNLSYDLLIRIQLCPVFLSSWKYLKKLVLNEIYLYIIPYSITYTFYLTSSSKNNFSKSMQKKSMQNL